MTIRKNKTVKMDSINEISRTDMIWTAFYKLEDKVDKLIKFLEDSESDACRKKIFKLISGKRPY